MVAHNPLFFRASVRNTRILLIAFAKFFYIVLLIVSSHQLQPHYSHYFDLEVKNDIDTNQQKYYIQNKQSNF
jgi:hypothetical protein